MIPIEISAAEATKKDEKHFIGKSIRKSTGKKPEYQKKSDEKKSEKLVKKLDARLQSGLIPYRFNETTDELEIMLITSSHKNNWGFPKGGQEKQLSPQNNAAKEAFEEGGISGKKKMIKLGHYTYVKGSTDRDQVVAMFGMEVTKEHTNWPEKTMRSRKWFAYNKALQLLPKELTVFARRLNKELKKIHR